MTKFLLDNIENWLSAFSYFPTMFSKGYFIRVFKLKVGIVWYRVNSLPNDKILGLTKLKSFPDNKLNVARKMISLLDRVGNTVEKHW